MHRLLITQTILVILTTVIFAWYQGPFAAKAAAYGGLIAIANTLLLLWHKRRTNRLAADDAQGSVRIFFACAAERFFLTVVLFALGMGSLKLLPLPLILGFIASTAGSFLGSFKQSRL